MRSPLLLLAVLAALLTGCSNAEPPTDPPAAAVAVVPVYAAKPTGLDIPAIGVHATSIVELTLDVNDVMQIPQDAHVTGWFALSPAPGDIGPAVIAAHVNYNGAAGVFARLHELKPGDRITVPRADGSTVAFEVYEVGQFEKDTFPTERVYGNTPSPELRLITCGGELDQGAHSYLDNIVVFARLAA